MVSTLRQHFSALIFLCPLEIQKRLRLNEARRRMLNGQMDAATAAFEVGYESPSKFSREYSRLFGAPPIWDIMIIAGGPHRDHRREPAYGSSRTAPTLALPTRAA